MRKLEKNNLKVFAQRYGNGPFSYIAFPKGRRTLLSWEFVDGDLIMVDQPASRALSVILRRFQVSRITTLQERLAKLVWRISPAALNLIELRLGDILDSIDLRYERENNESESESES